MNISKEIENSFGKTDNEVDAIEEQEMRDSVLAIASTNFKENDVLELPLIASKRAAVAIVSDYPGKPVSRKKYSEDVGVDDVGDSGGVELENSNSESGSEEEALEESSVDSGEDDDIEDEQTNSENSEVEDDKSDEKGDIDDPVMKMFTPLSAVPQSDIQRGLAVKDQLRLWESLLECRIKLEPSLVAANQLLQKDQMKAFIKNDETSSAIDSALNALSVLSTSWKTLQDLIVEKADNMPKMGKLAKDLEDDNEDNESINSSEASGIEEISKNDADDDPDDQPPVKRAKTIGAHSLNDSYSEFSPFRDAEIDRWNEKAKISSGRAAQKDFSAFDQSILKLIESILFDKYRLVKKTQLKRADYVIYGKNNETANEPENNMDEGELEVVDDSKEQKKKALEYDPEIFDDGDFYQKLLRDFIEGKSSDGGVSKHERKLMELHRLRIKMKRKIDTKATKGRKLRYVVHQKLVSFMAPVPVHSISVEAESQLLRSLFGQASSNASS